MPRHYILTGTFTMSRWPKGRDLWGGFLGGTHSVRPHSDATRKPRHNMIIGGKRTFGGLMGRSPGGSEAC